MAPRLLRVFISYAHEDEQVVKKIYNRLVANGVAAWFDKAKLFGGQEWESEITKQVDIADVILICLSKKSIGKEGFIQKEIKFALGKADEKPEGTIFIIPIKLEDCDVPARLSKYQWINLFGKYVKNGYQKLSESLNIRAADIGATFHVPQTFDAVKITGKSFGKIIESLRNDLELSRVELAVKAGIDYDLISKIEDGNQQIFEIPTLNSLSLALGLTNLEQREFLSAVGSIGNENGIRMPNKVDLSFFDFEETVEQIKSVVSRLRIPAFVTDVYSDVVFSNAIALDFLEIKKELIESVQDTVDGNNIMRILFHPDSNYHSLVGDDWENHALLNIRFFRRMSLRYRASKYFSELLKQLYQYPDFAEHYKKAIRQESDEFVSYAVYSVNSQRHGKSIYTGTESFLTNTPCGELYLHLYLPLDLNTEKVFERLFDKHGETCLPFSPFPDERKCGMILNLKV